MTYKKDYNELLLLLLRMLVKDALHFEEIVSGSTTRLTHVEVKVDDLKNKVRARNTFALDSYLPEEHRCLCLLSVPKLMVLSNAGPRV
jgi:DNA replication licensing factor MCM2